MLAYYAGLNGGFIFDDYPNLKPLGDLGGINGANQLKYYILGGFSGPTGRPLTLLSFLIDDNAWPSVAASFKYTNICLHLICGLLLAWVTYLLLISAHIDERRAARVAVLTAGLWMLHPYWVSTTLYVVQRMTILSALFMLLGMVGYLKGRMWLMQPEKNSPFAAYVFMTSSTVLGTILAVLSKENGALLPLLLIVVEVFLRRMQAGPFPNKIWLAIVLGLPALIVLLYLVSQINLSPSVWPGRDFNQIERVYSEARVLWDYLGNLWLPRIESAGLFRDGFVVSRGVLEPISTLYSVLGWMAVLVLLPFVYRYQPIVWLSITFFLCGHLIESTVIGLELYFEHRNYVPALFMFLPLAVGVDWLEVKYRPRVAIIVTLALFSMLAGLTWQRSSLWGDSDKLQSYWAVSNPQSARGRNYLIGRFLEKKEYFEALLLADKAVQELPDSALLTITWLHVRVHTGLAVEQDFKKAETLLVQQSFDTQAVVALRQLVNDIVASPELAHYRMYLLKLLNALDEYGSNNKFPSFLRIMSYGKARLHLAIGEAPEATSYYLDAIKHHGLASSAMQMFSEVASAGYLIEAQRILDFIQEGVNSGNLRTDPLGKDYYVNELKDMGNKLSNDIGKFKD